MTVIELNYSKYSITIRITATYGEPDSITITITSIFHNQLQLQLRNWTHPWRGSVKWRVVGQFTVNPVALKQHLKIGDDDDDDDDDYDDDDNDDDDDNVTLTRGEQGLDTDLYKCFDLSQHQFPLQLVIWFVDGQVVVYLLRQFLPNNHPLLHMGRRGSVVVSLACRRSGFDPPGPGMLFIF